MANSDPDPSSSFLFVAGMHSSAGKSTTCLTILSHLFSNGYSADSLAYIKPVTQCEQIQPVTKFCHDNGIRHVDIGPVVFRAGVTYECIEESEEEGLIQRQKRLDSVIEAVKKVGRGRKFVLIDGLGYASVGGVAGVSNAQVAAALGAPVLLVGKTGVGDAIDSMNMAHIYFRHYGAKVLGAIFSKVRVDCARHPLENCKKYVTMYFDRHAGDLSVKIYGFVPENPDLKRSGDDEEVCVFVPKKLQKQEVTDGCCNRKIDVTEDDRERISQTTSYFSGHVSLDDL
eukprot:CAMPEP_0201490310 /NCGR_PEP_ID=MMETSP0151_2-20130828/26120_1 /ASSEMBLY_ACC=CAM_ASM_000257 /TAXON_ID=200890 /ORGANISM="Paramoeba atlantica, Strain 621/1 / CCAP 1560/9" /LENGTH=284 /DNA_ID=CAMNT_0047876225 /DNA_START=60 /DNA_END=911 /DNA_ORIENTATION=-